jgi:hypothetical protein
MIEVEVELLLHLTLELDDLMDCSIRDLAADQVQDAEVMDYRLIGVEK